MTKRMIVSTLAGYLVFLAGCQPAPVKFSPGSAWQTDFQVNKADLASTGTNPYFVLEPGHTLRYGNGSEILVITVLNETRTIDGVVTRVVEERETKDGQPVEISRNYYAIDKTSRNVYYFGEEVDMYKDGKVASHEGSWLAGGANRFGMMMPGTPKAGEMFYQELAPRMAMDRSEIVSLAETVTTQAGTFNNCLHIKDGSAIEAGTGSKWYAPGIGLVKDGDQELVKVEKAK
jgi:hypothetical protein